MKNNKMLKDDFEITLRKANFYEDLEKLNEDEKKLVIKFKNKFMDDLFFMINSIQEKNDDENNT